MVFAASQPCPGNVGMHWVDSCSRQGGIRAACCASNSHTEGAGWRWDQNRSLWTDLKPFLPILPVFVKRDNVGHLRLKAFQGTEWVEEGWSFPVECAPVAACFGGRSGQGILVKGLRTAACAAEITQISLNSLSPQASASSL